MLWILHRLFGLDSLMLGPRVRLAAKCLLNAFYRVVKMLASHLFLNIFDFVFSLIERFEKVSVFPLQPVDGGVEFLLVGEVVLDLVLED